MNDSSYALIEQAVPERPTAYTHITNVTHAQTPKKRLLINRQAKLTPSVLLPVMTHDTTDKKYNRHCDIVANLNTLAHTPNDWWIVSRAHAVYKRMRYCGNVYELTVQEGKAKPIPRFCESYLCEYCGIRRHRIWADTCLRAIEQEIPQGRYSPNPNATHNRLHEATLTLRLKPRTSLKRQVWIMRKATKILFRSKVFKRLFTARVRVYAYPYTPGKGFNMHADLLLECNPNAKEFGQTRRELSKIIQRLWRTATEKAGCPSWRVDRDDDGLEYSDVTERNECFLKRKLYYSIKESIKRNQVHNSAMPKEALAEMLDALKGLRTVSTAGNWKRLISAYKKANQLNKPEQNKSEHVILSHLYETESHVEGMTTAELIELKRKHQSIVEAFGMTEPPERMFDNDLNSNAFYMRFPNLHKRWLKEFGHATWQQAQMKAQTPKKAKADHSRVSPVQTKLARDSAQHRPSPSINYPAPESEKKLIDQPAVPWVNSAGSATQQRQPWGAPR